MQARRVDYWVGPPRIREVFLEIPRVIVLRHVFFLLFVDMSLKKCSRLVWTHVKSQHRCKIVAVGECVVLFMTQQDWSSHVHELGGSKAYLNCHPNGTWTHIGHDQNLNIELFIVLGGYFTTHNRGRARTKDEGSGIIKTFGQRRGPKENPNSDGSPIDEIFSDEENDHSFFLFFLSKDEALWAKSRSIWKPLKIWRRTDGCSVSGEIVDARRDECMI